MKGDGVRPVAKNLPRLAMRAIRRKLSQHVDSRVKHTGMRRSSEDKESGSVQSSTSAQVYAIHT
jgi:hypothetical protein